MRFSIFSIILIFSALAFGQSDSLSLTGLARNIEFKERNSSDEEIELHIDFKMSVTNKSKENIIFFFRYKQCDQVIVSKSNGEKIGVFALPTPGFLPGAKQIAENLNQNSPPQKFSRILSPEEVWEFDFDFGYWIPKKNNRTEIRTVNEKGETFVVVTSSMNNSPITLEDIKSSRGLNFQIDCRLTPVWVENNEIVQDIKFFEKLNKKWKKYGNLWTGDLISEPILVDFQKIN